MINIDLSQLFSFELDQFQKQAIAALNAGKSVVVCAPTGSGKTLVGEYAIHRALARGGRVFYTTPLKALSNQKLRDFREQFGQDLVGLLTGDIAINRDAPILVMTTEIFRNMLYGTPIGQVGTSLAGLEVVVLDECHYMNDRQRGTVWEESIIYCPTPIQLVALSATVANSQQLTDWINNVHGQTELIYSDFRPVPLQFFFGNPKGIFPLLDKDKKQLNPKLQEKRPRRYVTKDDRPEAPSIPFVVAQLQERSLLPAIYFIFSRRGCDRAVQEMGKVSLVDTKEAAQIKALVDDFCRRHPEAARSGQVEPLCRGIAAHHAGILPTWKSLVEELFAQGLVKVVFATETLAAGINMPARTTVISSLSKRTDQGHRLLMASEFLQMAGRAGRRGMDTTGNVVILQTPFEGAKEAGRLAMAQPDPLVSQFTPSYGMVLNLLQTHTLPQVKELIEKSFAQYLATGYLQPQRLYINELIAEQTKIDVQLAAVDAKQLAAYEKMAARLKEERRLLKILQQQSQEVYQQHLSVVMESARPGWIVYLKGKHFPVAHPVPAVVVEIVAQKLPLYVCLGNNNRWYVATDADIAGIGQQAKLPRMMLPTGLELKPGQSLKEETGNEAVLKLLEGAVFTPVIAPEVQEQMTKVQELDEQLKAHPIRQHGDPTNLLRKQQRRAQLQGEISDRQAKLRQQQSQNWQEFLNLIEILREFNCLDDLTPTENGQAAAAIRGENELWLGLALKSGCLDDLDPPRLAAAIAALVLEPPRPDSWTNYEPPLVALEALYNLRHLRRQLFQAQNRYQVGLPIWLEYDMVGIVEQWALGVEWQELGNNTNLDEGDVVRMLRRTLDLLSQIPHVPHLSVELQRRAIAAIQLLDRFPVNESII